MAKLARIRGISLPILLVSLCLISGCAMGGNSSSSGQPTPTPTPAPATHAVALTWNPVTSVNVQGYRVYRGQTSGGPYMSVSNTLAGTTVQFTDSSVLAGQNYFYVVTSIDMNGIESAPSPEVSTTVPTS